MEYYELLNLKKEPFSNSPDPNYLFQSRQHRQCLQRLELSIRLKRGLNVVVGEVGTGKTTLCRQLLVKFGKDEAFETYLILEPQVCGPTDFLMAIATHFNAEAARRATTDAALKEIIKNHLFSSGVEKGKTIVLIIDEGQKMPPFSLEIVRELLNYETNEHKLLQIVIFAQLEFDAVLEGHANVADRISLRHELGPMGFSDTRLMIAYRLFQAGLTGGAASPFSFPSVVAIYLATGGYPRKIVNLCHQCVLALLIQNRRRAGWRLVRSCVQRMRMDPGNRLGKAGWTAAAVAAAAALVIVAGIFWAPRPLSEPQTQASAVTASPAASPQMPAAVSSPPGPTPPPVTMAASLPPPAPTGAPSPAGLPLAPAGSPGAGIGATMTTIAASPPDSLGEAALKRLEMLSWLMIKIYGGYSPELLGRVLKANPGIGNPDAIEEGRRIRFPATPVTLQRRFDGNWWVSIVDTDRFDDALEMVRRYPARMKPVRMIPYWHGDRGLRFTLVLWEYFRSETDALAAAADVSVMAERPTAVVAGWPAGAILFADPFAGTRK